MADRGFFLIAYDIASPKRLARVARYLESLGERVQYSVFEIYLSPTELELMFKRLEKFIDSKEDSLRVYGLCATCRSRVRTHGRGMLTPPPGVVIV